MGKALKTSHKIPLQIGVILSAIFLMSCQLLALPVTSSATPPAEAFSIQDGKLVEWQNGSYHSISLGDVDSKKVLLAVKNGQPIMNMRLQWEQLGDDNSTIYKSDELTIGEYVNGAWQIRPFMFTVVPESIKTAQEHFSTLSSPSKELFKNKIENGGDKAYYLTFASSFPVGMKYDSENKQIIFLLTNQDGFALVRPQVITLAIIHKDQKDTYDRIAIRNRELSLVGIVDVLEKLQYTRMTYAPDASVRKFFYMVDISAIGPKISTESFAKNQSAMYADKKFYPNRIGDFSMLYFKQLVEGTTQRYTIENLESHWKWMSIDKIISGNDPWMENELDFPGVSIELYLNDSSEER